MLSATTSTGSGSSCALRRARSGAATGCSTASSPGRHTPSSSQVTARARCTSGPPSASAAGGCSSPAVVRQNPGRPQGRRPGLGTRPARQLSRSRGRRPGRGGRARRPGPARPLRLGTGPPRRPRPAPARTPTPTCRVRTPPVAAGTTRGQEPRHARRTTSFGNRQQRNQRGGMSTVDDELMTVEETAAYLRVPVGTL